MISPNHPPTNPRHYSPGDTVLLRSPGERYDGLHATVVSIHEWGIAFLVEGYCVPEAVEGWCLRGRALWSEIARETPQAQPEMVTASGDICPTCQSLNMIRTGPCLTCLNCGSSNGGCS